jgi:hypothetical protein
LLTFRSIINVTAGLVAMGHKPWQTSEDGIVLMLLQQLQCSDC